MTRTERHDVTIVGGSMNGLRVVLVDRPNGESYYIDGGTIFFPDGVADYTLDRENWTLTAPELRSAS